MQLGTAADVDVDPTFVEEGDECPWPVVGVRGHWR